MTISNARTEHVRRLVRRDYRKIAAVSPDARLLHVYAMFVCDDTGHVKNAQMEPPWDTEAQRAAEAMCAEFNLLGMDN